MKVFAIYDPLYKRVNGVYDSEGKAQKVMAELNEVYDRLMYLYTYDGFELNAAPINGEY